MKLLSAILRRALRCVPKILKEIGIGLSGFALLFAFVGVAGFCLGELLYSIFPHAYDVLTRDQTARTVWWQERTMIGSVMVVVLVVLTAAIGSLVLKIRKVIREERAKLSEKQP